GQLLHRADGRRDQRARPPDPVRARAGGEGRRAAARGGARGGRAGGGGGRGGAGAGRGGRGGARGAGFHRPGRADRAAGGGGAPAAARVNPEKPPDACVCSVPMHCFAPRARASIRGMRAAPATASPLVRRYTLEEFFLLGLPPGHGHYELIAGVLYVVPPPTSRHDLVQSRLNMTFAAYAVAHPNDCVLLVPRSAADLVVEISSPGSAVYDRTAKADTYAALGVRELWLVDLEQRAIERRILAEGGWREAEEYTAPMRLESVVFPGLAVVPDEVFAS